MLIAALLPETLRYLRRARAGPRLAVFKIDVATFNREARRASGQDVTTYSIRNNFMERALETNKEGRYTNYERCRQQTLHRSAGTLKGTYKLRLRPDHER